MTINRPLSIYFSEDQKVRIQDVADHAGIKRHALLKYAVLYFIQEYKKNPQILIKEKRQMIKFPEIK